MRLMGDYNHDYLNSKERQSLDTVRIPYRLNVKNTSVQTRNQRSSKTLIDHIITDPINPGNLKIFVSGTPFRTNKNQTIDHRTTALITYTKIKSRKKVFQKVFFDNFTYNKHRLRDLLKHSDWGYFYYQNSAKPIFTIFVNYNETALSKSIKKKAFIRNDRSNVTIHQQWFKNDTRNIYNKMIIGMKPGDAEYARLLTKSLNDKTKR